MLDKIEFSKILNDPFDHIIIDNFFDESLALTLANQFPIDKDFLFKYNNDIEIKQVCNHWDRFPKETYKVFWDLCGQEITEALSKKFNTKVYPDIGLNGGGWHIHKFMGKLNIHQDYYIHPKINYKRKLNIIIYLSEKWDTNWGGGLQFWSHDSINNSPKNLVKTIDVKFNRAVIFDTTQNSWHGLPDSIMCPIGYYRKSLAMYYLTDSDSKSARNRALFVPTEEQKNNKEILDFIYNRSK